MHKLNWHPDIPDFRDYLYKSVHKYSIDELPPLVDLRPKMSPVENQDQLGSCTSFALAGALEFLEEQSLITKTSSPEILTPNSYTPFSHLFIYYNERDAEGDPNEDGGGQLRDGIKTLVSLGVCSELTWPYDESKVFVKPPDVAYQEAAQHKISSYLRLESPSDFKHTLASGFPFVFGATLYSSFESNIVGNTGVVPMPLPDLEVIGGHALLCVGYDMDKQYYIVRNSWSSTWGDKGYCYFPMQYIENENLCTDMWTIRR